MPFALIRQRPYVGAVLESMLSCTKTVNAKLRALRHISRRPAQERERARVEAHALCRDRVAANGRVQRTGPDQPPWCKPVTQIVTRGNTGMPTV